MSIGKNISHEESIAVNLEGAIFEVGSSFEAMSREAVDMLDAYTTDKRVVDLGCGDGAGVKRFVELGYTVTGVDINQHKLDRVHGASTVCKDFMSYLNSLSDASAPNIFCHHALEHYPFYQAVLNEIGRVLKPGGYCLIVVPAGGEFRGPHHALFGSPKELLPPGTQLVYGELKTRQEDEVWCLTKK